MHRRHRALMSIVVCRHASSSSHVMVVYRLCASLNIASTYIDVALPRALLHVVIVVSCHCRPRLSVSSDRADHCFL